ncbi:hypothetical protein DRN67_04060, partial [Candidatus Micrarchaeota archaeon]
MKRAALSLFVLLLLSNFALALDGPVAAYIPTTLDVSLGKADDDSNVKLIVKIYEVKSDGTKEALIDPKNSETTHDFYVYEGMISKRDILSEHPVPSDPYYIVSGSGDVDFNTNRAEIEFPRPSAQECFVTVVYWGYEDASYDPAVSYAPSLATIPACESGGVITFADVLPSNLTTALCLPLVLLLGLLVASMYVQGKNVLAGFDFSSPRVSGGRHYTMRRRWAVHAVGTMLFNMGMFGGTQYSQQKGAKKDQQRIETRRDATTTKTPEGDRTVLPGMEGQHRALSNQLQEIRERRGQMNDLRFGNQALQRGSPVGVVGHPFIIGSGGGLIRRGQTGQDIGMGAAGSIDTIIGEISGLFNIGKNIKAGLMPNLEPTKADIEAGRAALLMSLPLIRNFYQIYAALRGTAAAMGYNPRTQKAREREGQALEAEAEIERLANENRELEAQLSELEQQRTDALSQGKQTEADALQQQVEEIQGDIEENIGKIIIEYTEVLINRELARSTDAVDSIEQINRVIEGDRVENIINSNEMTAVQKEEALQQINEETRAWRQQLGGLGYQFDFTAIQTQGQWNEMNESFQDALTVETDMINNLPSVRGLETISELLFRREEVAASSRFKLQAARIYNATGTEITMEEVGERWKEIYNTVPDDMRKVGVPQEFASNFMGFMNEYGHAGIA